MNRIISIIAILIVGMVMILVGWLWWFSPMLMLIGAILSISMILGLIVVAVIRDDYEKAGVVEFFISIAIFCIIGILVTGFFMRENCYITEFGHEKHYYEDCNNLANYNKKYKVCKLSALIFGAFDECVICSQKKKADLKRLKEEKIKKRINSDLEFIDAQIKELKVIREIVSRGNIIDCEDFMFKYQIEEDDYDDYDDFGVSPLMKRD